MPVWKAAHPVFNARDINYFLDIILFIGVAGYIFIFFSLSYLWSRKKFSLILKRVDRICNEIQNTGRAIELKFRKGDRFKFFDATFNNAVLELEDHNLRRINALKQIEADLRTLSRKVDVEEVDRLIEDLNGPPWGEHSSKAETAV